MRNLKALLERIRKHEHNPLDTFILFVIVFSAILIGLETDADLHLEYASTFHVLDMLILWIFVCEVVIKIYAEGKTPWKYFKSGWNLFDFFIVLAGFAPIIIHAITHSSSEGDFHFLAAARVIRLARALRVVRVFRLITHLRPLQILVETLLRSIPSMLYVALLMMMLFYVYAIVGVSLFAANDPAHFGSINHAALTLFQCMTGDSWSDIMKIQMIAPVAGSATEDHSVIAPIYFVTFMIFASFIILNLVIGIIVSAMEEARTIHVREELAAIKAEEQAQSEDLDLVREDLARILRRLDEFKR
ncbi:MAG: ion transporter [bacterium]|nr:ion transporter [bacterium]